MATKKKSDFPQWKKFSEQYGKAENVVDAFEIYRKSRLTSRNNKKAVKLNVEKGSYFEFIPMKNETLIYKEKTKGKRKMTDTEVIWARQNVQNHTYAYMAEVIGVSPKTLYSAIKGFTFSHLNHIVKPQK
jgi:hypothetical protein